MQIHLIDNNPNIIYLENDDICLNQPIYIFRFSVLHDSIVFYAGTNNVELDEDEEIDILLEADYYYTHNCPEKHQFLPIRRKHLSYQLNTIQ